MSFVHLHTHSEFSLLDGANRITDLVEKTKEFELPAVALTDHGCLFGAWTFHKEAKKAGVKPIIGMEAYVAPGDRRDKSRSGQGERAYYHLVLLARDQEGYKNLVKLSSIGYTEGFYHRPRVDREVLAKYSKGLIVSSACMAGEVARHLLAGDRPAAKAAAEWYANLFDGRYYLEVQAHHSEGQAKLNAEIFSLADDLGLPVVATNDAHFLNAGDHDAHDVLLCIGLGKDRSDPNRMKYDEGLYYKSAKEVAAHFPGRPDVLENTLLIADQVDLSFEKKYHLPAFPLPREHKDENEYLVHLATGGAEARYGSPLPAQVQERLDYELGVIKGTGYAGYFLITWDFIDWARRHGIPVGPGRGSAAGSLVAYALGITNICPLVHDLLFERFLNPERISMPDIDVDFCFERRGEVIDYVRKKYGADAVGQIVTFGTMKSRAVIRDVGRTLGFAPSETDRIAKLIPNLPQQSFTVEQAVKQLKEVRDLYKSDDRHRKLFDYSMTLEGLARHASVHAAGVVIAPGPLDDYVPVCIQTGKNGTPAEGETAMAVTQYDMNCLDEAGMLKMDFLGLKTLTVIHDAVEMVRARVGGIRQPETGVVYETMDHVPLDDPAVYRMLARGGVSGVFQFESNLALDKLRAMKCDRFDDLVATNALIRPGPLDSGMTDVYIRRKLGLEPVRYPHPDLVKTLEPTYGIIVYQEQVMRIANLLAGFSLGEADVLRKAVGKKDGELIKKELGRFVVRAVERGVDRTIAEDLANQIETFGNYGFNKCLVGHVEVLDAASGRMVKIEDAYAGRARLDTVLACDTELLRLVEAPVADIVDNGIRPVWRLRTESGREIEATATHPFLTYEGWKPLGEIATGVHIAVPRSLSVAGSSVWPEHEVVSLGHLIAEGNLCHPTGLYVYNKDERQLDDFARAAESFSNVRCSRGVHRDCGYVYTGRVDRRLPNGIFEWARGLDLLGKTATEKEIPAAAFELGADQLGLLLARMWEGDGHVSWDEHPSLYYATSSKRLAHQVAHLLLRLGVSARTRAVDFRYRGELKRGYQVHVHNNDNRRAFAEGVGRHFLDPERKRRLEDLILEDPQSGPSKDVVPVGVRNRIRELKASRGLRWAEVAIGAGVASRDLHPSGSSSRKVGFTRGFVGALAEYFDDLDLTLQAQSGVLWDRVVEVEYVGEMRTYDLEVPIHHNFVANDLIVHNSHAAAYSLVSYHTAWLKAHYPAEFMAAMLSAVLDKTDDVVRYIAECKDITRCLPHLEHGIQVLPPDVNESGWKFTTVGDHQIRFGLGAVRGVGSGAVASILGARAEGGAFKSLFDFLGRIDTRALNKRACEALIAAGALDAYGRRSQLLSALDHAYQEVQARQAEQASGQESLFGAASTVQRKDPVLPEVPEWDEADRLAREKEALGFFISGHPLDRFREVVRAFDRTSSATLKERAGEKVELPCVVTSVARQISRKDSSEWGKIQVEDFFGTATVLAFKEAWQIGREKLVQDAVVLVRGLVSSSERDEEAPPIFLDDVELLEGLPTSGRLAVQIDLEFDSGMTEEAFAQARTVLARHPGVAPVEIAVGNGGGARLRSRTLKADATNGTLEELQAVFGRNRVRLVKTGDWPALGTPPEKPHWRNKGRSGGDESPF